MSDQTILVAIAPYKNGSANRAEIFVCFIHGNIPCNPVLGTKQMLNIYLLNKKS